MSTDLPLAGDLFARTERQLLEAAAATDDAKDRAALITFVALLRRADDARRRVDSEGLIVEDAKGYANPHPALAIETAASRELRGWIDRRPDLFGSGAAQPPTGGAKHADAKPAGGGLADELAAARAARTSPA